MRLRRALAAGLLIGAGCAATPATVGAATKPGERPNILVIVTDDQRAEGTLDVMPKTRRWFAREGTTFTNAFVTTPLCCPSRASILTGNYAHNHFAFVNDINRSSAPFEHSRGIQRYLRKGGYRTGIVGKYLNGFPLESKPPFFDDYFVHEAFYYRSRWNAQGKVKDVRGYSTTYARNRSRQLLRKYDKGKKPWFLYVATNAPHSPLTSEPKYRGSDCGPPPNDPAVTETDLADKPPWIKRLDQGREFAFGVRCDQRRILRSADDMVDGIMGELRRLGESRNTLAIFTSDNGLFWGEHGNLAIKDLPYDPSTKVPMLMRWPGKVARGRIDDRLVANLDIAPTAVDATGIRGPLMDGRSLLSRGSRDRLLLEYGGLTDLIPAWSAIRRPTQQYTEYYSFPGRDRTHALPGGAATERQNEASFLEYYDLLADPFQVDNIASRREPPVPPELSELASQLHRDMDCRGRTCP